MYCFDMKRLPVLAAFLTLISAPAAISGETINVTDLAGRTVTVKHGVERVILGQGRMLDSIAILEKDAPFKEVHARFLPIEHSGIFWGQLQ
jgi:ABC-type Fe3+-hydroxamate transport system substrate-binding protein